MHFHYFPFQILVYTGEDKLRRGLLAIPNKEQLEKVLKYMLDENEFLSQYGIRSLSKVITIVPLLYTGLIFCVPPPILTLS